ncbi:hypothetical protein [Metabacillus litoralis]|uniref:hypothetical protein n=1 Tax=Metabacillus litoralis TaxID=152268 RepID=UPI000EF5F023|nr:hypothetical protein [Metabacillus litoralis]
MRTFISRGIRALFHNKMNDVPTMDHYSQLSKIAMGAIMAALAVIFQSAGIFIGFGYVLSMLATWPMIIAASISFQIGILAYVTTIFLLAIVQPSEVLVFAFTTGLLGISIGYGLRKMKNVFKVMLFAGATMLLGIIVLITLFQFPILGPSANSLGFGMLGSIFLFSLLYSWIWIKVSLIGMKVLQKAIPERKPSLYDREG